VFSTRSDHDDTQNALARALDRRRACGGAVVDLTVSNPTRAALPYDGETIRHAFSDARGLLYTPEPLGLLSARQAVVDSLPVRGVDPSRVLLTSSTSEAYSYLLKLLCDPGDDVLVPRPSYPLFTHLAAFESVRVRTYRLAYDGEWHVDLGDLRAAVTPRTRALILVHPNNPTGSHLKRDEAQALLSLGLPVISDEVFQPYRLVEDPAILPSVLSLPAPLTFCLGGLSKLCGLPQAKLAWTVVGGDPGHVREAMRRLELVADTFLSPGAAVQVALPALLVAGRVTREAILARVRENLAWLRSVVTGGSPASVLRVEGGWYAMLRLPRTRDDLAWALAFLEEDGVYVHPGSFFDVEDASTVVVSLVTPPADLQAGVGQLLARVRREA
jgi:hypothetical protein